MENTLKNATRLQATNECNNEETVLSKEETVFSKIVTSVKTKIFGKKDNHNQNLCIVLNELQPKLETAYLYLAKVPIDELPAATYKNINDKQHPYRNGYEELFKDAKRELISLRDQLEYFKKQLSVHDSEFDIATPLNEIGEALYIDNDKDFIKVLTNSILLLEGKLANFDLRQQRDNAGFERDDVQLELKENEAAKKAKDAKDAKEAKEAKKSKKA